MYIKLANLWTLKIFRDREIWGGGLVRQMYIKLANSGIEKFGGRGLVFMGFVHISVRARISEVFKEL